MSLLSTGEIWDSYSSSSCSWTSRKSSFFSTTFDIRSKADIQTSFALSIYPVITRDLRKWSDSPLLVPRRRRDESGRKRQFSITDVRWRRGRISYNNLCVLLCWSSVTPHQTQSHPRHVTGAPGVTQSPPLLVDV